MKAENRQEWFHRKWVLSKILRDVQEEFRKGDVPDEGVKKQKQN